MKVFKLEFIMWIALAFVTACGLTPAAPIPSITPQPFLTLPPRHTPTTTTEATDTATATTAALPSATLTNRPSLFTKTPTPTPTEVIFCPDSDSSSCGIIPRGCYRTDDIYNDPWLSGWAQVYSDARTETASWVLDPLELTLHYIGYFRSSQGSHDHVKVHDEISGEVMVLICDYGLLDDSVSGIERRIDLVQDGAFWVIQWAGARYHCQPGRGSPDWSPELCY